MREISLHIMDIIQNSIDAKAELITLEITEDIINNLLIIKIIDDGCGISENILPKITDPFITSRKSRGVGLGLSLFEATCIRCSGNLSIKSKVNVGTEVIASMEYNNIDRPPMGKIEETILSIVLTSDIDILYIHRVNKNEFTFDTREIKGLVGSELKDYEIVTWLKEYILENLEAIGAGQ